MDTSDRVKRILRDALQLGDRARSMGPATPLMGSIPELDSMAVVTILTMIEDEFGFSIPDDEISGETFATLGSLTGFVEARVGS